ncbi:hypothetical protein QBC43DRAFT_286119 [Cladorrhinum sp. PSN259]|nr:hypothetical protein QBC43DRAFT_286119 [Cladorrhinum sp. PSN259]
MADQNHQGTSEQTLNDSYPRLIKYSCHSIAYGQLRRRGSYDHTRFRKFLREDELCPLCINLLIPNPTVRKSKEKKREYSSFEKKEDLEESSIEHGSEEEALGEEGDEIVEEYQVIENHVHVFRSTEAGPWYWEHEKAAHRAEQAKLKALSASYTKGSGDV